MATELAVQTENAVAVKQPESVLAMIARAASDPGVDIGKMQALIAMQREIMAHDAKMAYIQAMARLQPLLPRITERGQIVVQNMARSTFARYEDIDEVLRPLYTGEGFSIEFDTETTAQGLRIIMKLSHIGGHQDITSVTLPRDESGSKNATQGVGSTMSYGQRYLIKAKFNIITVGLDDDGQGSTPITSDQIQKIITLVDSTKADKAKFMTYMGVTQLDQITSRDFPKAMNALRAKARKA
jgi:hypothetical protein